MHCSLRCTLQGSSTPPLWLALRAEAAAAAASVAAALEDTLLPESVTVRSKKQRNAAKDFESAPSAAEHPPASAKQEEEKAAQETGGGGPPTEGVPEPTKAEQQWEGGVYTRPQPAEAVAAAVQRQGQLPNQQQAPSASGDADVQADSPVGAQGVWMPRADPVADWSGVLPRELQVGERYTSSREDIDTHLRLWEDTWVGRLLCLSPAGGTAIPDM
eukprot:gene8333-9902_t